MMEHVFKLSRGAKINAYSAIVAFLSMAILVCFQIVENKVNPMLFLFPLAMTVVAILAATSLRRRLIINDDYITYRYSWGTKVILIDEIAACKIDSSVELAFNVPDKKNIRISCSGFKDVDRLYDYFKTYWPNLDLIKLDKNIFKVIVNSNLGYNIDEKISLFRTARKISAYYNWIGLFIGLLLFLIPKPSVTFVALIYPLISILLLAIGKKIIKFAPTITTLNVPVFLGFLCPSLALTAYAANNYEVFSYSNFWTPFSVVTMLLLCLLIVLGKDKDSGRLKFQIGMMIVFSVLYGYGAIITANCSLDNSDTTVNHATVVEQTIVQGNNSPIYKILLSTAGPDRSLWKYMLIKKYITALLQVIV